MGAQYPSWVELTFDIFERWLELYDMRASKTYHDAALDWQRSDNVPRRKQLYVMEVQRTHQEIYHLVGSSSGLFTSHSLLREKIEDRGYRYLQARNDIFFF